MEGRGNQGGETGVWGERGGCRIAKKQQSKVKVGGGGMRGFCDSPTCYLLSLVFLGVS